MTSYRALALQTAEPDLVEENTESVEELEEDEISGLVSETPRSENCESISDNGSSNPQAWQRKVMYLGFIGVLCIGALGILISEMDASDSTGGLKPHHGPTIHGVFDAPQFEQMLWEQIQPVLGSSVSQMELSGHINRTIRHLKAKAEKELPKNQASALKNAQISPQNWLDLKVMARGSRNSEIQETGKITLNVLKHNLFSSEKVIAQRLKEALRPQASKLMQLRSQIVPSRLDIALGAWAKRHNESHAAWKGLVDSPSALQPIRKAHASVGRRLELGIGGVPVGILSVILVAIGEILVHVEIFVPEFSLPEWAWKLIMTPVEVVSALACEHADNAYCKIIEGAMGLNALDAVFILFCQKELFGEAAAEHCETESIDMQKDIANEITHTKVFK